MDKAGREQWYREEASRIVDEVMPTLKAAWAKVGEQYGLTPDEVWDVKRLEVYINDNFPDLPDVTFDEAVTMYKSMKAEGMIE